jgi:N-acetyl sugar amidotransferase
MSSHAECRRCVMDSSAPDFVAFDDGTCNYCRDFEARARRVLFRDPSELDRARAAMVERIRAAGRGKRYDCIVGLSGGVDSAWVLHTAVSEGLRPLAVHMDNGWNSELSQHNIERLIKSLGVDFYTHVIEWREYQSAQQAFFDADVIDVEMLYDNAMLAVNYQQAARWGVRAILAGTNQATEGMRMPPGWNWLKHDATNIRAIMAKGGLRRPRTIPLIGTLDMIRYHASGVRWISFLDLTSYRRGTALAELSRLYGYRPYPYKHYESVFTRFYQGYLLPRKFGVDKRRLHLSTLIVTGELSREEAARLLAESPYPSPADLTEDIEYFLRKMKWTHADLDAYLARPARSHAEFRTEQRLWNLARAIERMLRRKA